MKTIAIEWRDAQPSGQIEISEGELAKLMIVEGAGEIRGEQFSVTPVHGRGRLNVSLAKWNVQPGSGATIITVRAQGSFSFFLRDVSRKYPIYLPDLGVVVTDTDDPRSYDQIASEIKQRGLQTACEKIEVEPEEDFATASAGTRPTSCPTWLGLSRDIRVFEFDFPKAYEGTIRPRLHNDPVKLASWDNQPVEYRFALGRGVMCVHETSRRLEDGTLPILRGAIVDENVQYDLTAFVVLEKTPLSAAAIRGTDYLVAYSHGIGHTFTDDQKARFDEALAASNLDDEEPPVLFLAVKATNRGVVPRYAWLRLPIPHHAVEGWKTPRWTFDAQRGLGLLQDGEAFCAARINGAPLPQPELAILLAPGETASFDIRLPHRPISRDRAEQLAGRSFEECQAECKNFWSDKLASCAQIHLPEPRIDEMVRAGLLHLDMVAYGREPGGAVAACVGKYTPIGSESAPIIQFFDSMGHHSLARRALQFFFDLQRPNGSLDAFYGYVVETGAILWTAGEHYRYTRDDEWVRRIAPNLRRACEYLTGWRDRNKDDSLRGKGYGMIDGMVCDMPDRTRHFVLNGYACLGLRRVAEMLATIDAATSSTLKHEADEWQRDIRASLIEAMARSPVVPLRNGAWCPVAPPWPELCGPVATFAQRVDWYDEQRWLFFNRTGAHFVVRDSLLGPHYLIFQEILDLDEPMSRWLHDYHTDMFLKRNVASSQPYYSRHPWIHLKRRELKGFLKAYYNTLAAQADRETYSFPEGIIRSVTGIEKDSPHKTHEEAWFLMETRWMLYMEDGDTLRLLPGIPRNWLRQGQSINLENISTYFGVASLWVESDIAKGVIRARIDCDATRGPKAVELRLPHPDGAGAIRVEGGVYSRQRESVLISPFQGTAETTLHF